MAAPYGGVNAAIQMMLYFRQFSPSLRQPLPRPKLENTFPQFKDWDYLPDEILRWNSGLKQEKLTVPARQYALPDATVAQLSPLVGDAERLDFLYHILHEGGILQSGSPVKIWEEPYQRFLQMPVDEQRALLVRFYMSTRGWNELWAILRHDEKMQLKRNFIDSRIDYHKFITQLLQFRQWILQALAQLPDGEWLLMSDIDRIFRKIWADMRVDALGRYRSNATPAWEIQYRGKPLKTAQHSEDWDKLQGAFIRRVFTALHWLGMADFAGDDRDPIQSVRLLGFRDIFLKNSTPVAPDRIAVPSQNNIHVTGTRITANAVPDAAALLAISRFAILESVSATNATYRLDIATTHHSFESGLSAGDLLAAWQQKISPEVPPSIQKQLEQWWQAYGQVQLYQDMTLIEFADDHMLTEMKAVTSLNDWLVAEISPRAILISGDGVDTLVSELEKAGYTPKVTEQVTL